MTRTNKPTEKLTCIGDCKESKNKNKFFYNSKNKLYATTGKIPICKDCLKKQIDYDDIGSIYAIFRQLDIYFDIEYWEKAIASKSDTFGRYISMINSLHQLEGRSWKDSIFNEVKLQTEDTKTEVEPENQNADKIDISGYRNKEDVLRMLGYDPFEGESESDKRHLYNKLVDMLDESTLEDGFKLPAVIEIVKGFNQLDKLNRALALITSDTGQLARSVTGVKSLIDSKEKILKSMLALAKDNGISVNHNNNKSKGAGTLSGIIKTLQEKGIEEGDVNLFDIETAKGMRQVADLSNSSIMAQLQFDENDYTAMILEQRELIQALEDNNMKLEEENRLLKKEIMNYRKVKDGVLNER